MTGSFLENRLQSLIKPSVFRIAGDARGPIIHISKKLRGTVTVVIGRNELMGFNDARLTMKERPQEKEGDTVIYLDFRNGVCYR